MKPKEDKKMAAFITTGYDRQQLDKASNEQIATFLSSMLRTPASKSYADFDPGYQKPSPNAGPAFEALQKLVYTLLPAGDGEYDPILQRKLDKSAEHVFNMQKLLADIIRKDPDKAGDIKRMAKELISIVKRDDDKDTGWYNSNAWEGIDLD